MAEPKELLGAPLGAPKILISGKVESGTAELESSPGAAPALGHTQRSGAL